MTPKQTEEFNKLKENFKEREMTDVDLFDCIGGFIGSGQTNIAYSLAMHARDVCSEEEGESNYSEIISEVYRRTFFDLDKSRMYGMEPLTDSQLTGFVQLMIDQSKLPEVELDPVHYMESGGSGKH